jgi:hypothetical protein
MMNTNTTNTIDIEISEHRAWAEKFRAKLKHISDRNSGTLVVSSPEDCRLGVWLQTEGTSTRLGDQFHVQITSVHDTFHEVVKLISIKINEGASSSIEICEWLLEFDNLSLQLVSLLNRCKVKFEAAG